MDNRPPHLMRQALPTRHASSYATYCGALKSKFLNGQVGNSLQTISKIDNPSSKKIFKYFSGPFTVSS